MMVLVVLSFVVTFAIIALSLRLGVRWAHIPDVSWYWLLAATALIQFISAATALLGRAATGRGLPDEAAMAAELVLSVVVTLAALGAVLRTSPRRALKPWLATLGGSAAVAALLFLVAIPYLFEAFAVTSNAMAPTLIGLHHVAACPHCGGPAYTSATRAQATPDPFSGRGGRPHVAAICGRCLRDADVLEVPAAVGEADRFLARHLDTSTARKGP